MSENNTEEELEESEHTFISHLVELRDRLLKIIACVLIVFLGLSFYANQIYSFIAGAVAETHASKQHDDSD